MVTVHAIIFRTQEGYLGSDNIAREYGRLRCYESHAYLAGCDIGRAVLAFRYCANVLQPSIADAVLWLQLFCSSQ